CGPGRVLPGPALSCSRLERQAHFGGFSHPETVFHLPPPRYSSKRVWLLQTAIAEGSMPQWMLGGPITVAPRYAFRAAEIDADVILLGGIAFTSLTISSISLTASAENGSAASLCLTPYLSVIAKYAFTSGSVGMPVFACAAPTIQ